MSNRPDEIINLARYPLDALCGSAGRNLVKRVRSRLKETGCCTLDNFVNDDVLMHMARQARELAHLAYPGPTSVSPYFFDYRIGDALQVDDRHPTRRRGKRELAQVAADLIPQDHLLSVLYRSPLMTAFLAAVIEKPVYLRKDRYQPLNISVMNEGGCQQWHFDSGDMVTTLLLQAPESGGVFEFVPFIRSDDDEYFDEVTEVLDGDSSRVKSLRLTAGSLNLFRGHYSLHRVTAVVGETQRLQAILGYSTTPDHEGSIESSILHYGPRVAKIEGLTKNQV